VTGNSTEQRGLGLDIKKEKATPPVTVQKEDQLHNQNETTVKKVGSSQASPCNSWTWMILGWLLSARWDPDDLVGWL
jgi:hypothetical protein